MTNKGQERKMNKCELCGSPTNSRICKKRRCVLEHTRIIAEFDASLLLLGNTFVLLNIAGNGGFGDRE